MSMIEFGLEEKRNYEKEYLRKRFESLLRTVSHKDKIKLQLDAGVSRTDGVHVALTDPFTYLSKGFTTEEAITIALHCTVHEASHVLYSGIPSDLLKPMSAKYIPLGYVWKKLFMLIDMLEDYRVNTLCEATRPGTTSYRQDTARLMLKRAKFKSAEIDLMTKWFADLEPEPEDGDLFFALDRLFDQFSQEGTCPQDSGDYAVRMYDILYPKESGEGGEDGDGEDEGFEGDDGESVDTFKGDGGGDESELIKELDNEGGENNGESKKDASKMASEGEKGETSEKGEPDDKTTHGFSQKPAVMDDTTLADELDKAVVEAPSRKVEGKSSTFGGTAYVYPYSPVKGAKIISAMTKVGLHDRTRVVYVKLPEDKTNFAGCDNAAQFRNDLKYLNSPEVQNTTRTFTAKAGNVLKLNNAQSVPYKKSGKLMAGRVWRAPQVQDVRVFSKQLDSSHGDTAVYLLCDNSGSMCGLYERTRVAVYMLAKALMAYGIPCKVVAFDASYELESNCVRHVELKDWEEKTADGIARYSQGHDNRDGLDIHIASLELAQRPEKNKILMIFSDGQPADGTSTPGHGYSSVSDTANQVRKARGMGIKTLGIFMSDGGGTDVDAIEFRSMAHKTMYGDELYTISAIEQIPSLLLKALGRFTK